MINEQHKQKLIQLIKTSSILTTQEKADWLALLDLMNDKQLAELEEILNLDNSVSAVQVSPNTKQIKQAPPPVLARPIKSPPNLPEVLDSNMPLARSAVFIKESSENNLKIPDTKKSQPSFDYQPDSEPKVKDIQNFDRDSQTPKGVTPLRHIENLPSQFNIPDNSVRSNDAPSTVPQSPEFIPSPKLQDHHAAESIPLKLEVFEDIKGLKSEMFNLETVNDVTLNLKSFADQSGYFNVLQEFEQSQLYKDYLEYGKFLLSENKSEKEIFLSQTEFELVTDLLLSLKVNRV